MISSHTLNLFLTIYFLLKNKFFFEIYCTILDVVTLVTIETNWY